MSLAFAHYSSFDIFMLLTIFTSTVQAFFPFRRFHASVVFSLLVNKHFLLRHHQNANFFVF